MGFTSSQILVKIRALIKELVIHFDGSRDRGIFIEMINDSGGSVVRGDTVMIDAAKGRNYFDTSATGDDDQVFGMAAEAIADGARGRIQTYGPTKYLKVDGTDDISVADFISSFTTAKIAQKGTIGSGNCFAIACEAYTTNDSNGVIDAFLLGSAR